jgi:hypothetical protein
MATMVALIQAVPATRADDVGAYCRTLTHVVGLVRAKDKFAGIIGKPREGNFLETTLPLPGWADCSFYGTRTYACDSRPFDTADDAERAFARTLGEVKSCLRDGWAEDQSRASHGYAVVHDDRQLASITINTDKTEKNEHVVRLILFLRSR